MTVIDTCVLLDVVANDRVWADWSIAQLEAVGLNGPLVINDAVYAELSVGYEDKERLDNFVTSAQLTHEQLPTSALFLAGQAFLRYRKAKGGKTGVLPDFFIGAHAAVLQAPLLTRDVQRFKTYFPTVTLIAP